MASKSQVLLNPQVLFEDEEADQNSSQMGFFSTFLPSSNLTFVQVPSMAAMNNSSPNSPPFEAPNFCTAETLLSSSSLLPAPKQRDHHCPSSQFVAHHLLSLQTSNANLWWVFNFVSQF